MTDTMWIDIDPSHSRDFPSTVNLWKQSGDFGKTPVKTMNFRSDRGILDIIDAVFMLRKLAPGCRIECDTRGPGAMIICELHRALDHKYANREKIIGPGYDHETDWPGKPA